MSREEEIKKLLEDHFWLQTLKTRQSYSRQHDDTDGTTLGYLTVQFTVDGDAWISIDQHKTLRFRMIDGGGQSRRTRNALLILAEAMRLDNEENNENRNSKNQSS